MCGKDLQVFSILFIDRRQISTKRVHFIALTFQGISVRVGETNIEISSYMHGMQKILPTYVCQG